MHINVTLKVSKGLIDGNVIHFSLQNQLPGFSEMGQPGSVDKALDQVQTKCSLGCFADAITYSGL